MRVCAVLAVMMVAVAQVPLGALAQDISASSRYPRCGFDDVRIVPPITGLTEEKAAAVLADCDLTLTMSDQQTLLSDAPIGAVARQFPASGSVVKIGAAVTAQASAGMYLPTMIGQSGIAAEAFLASIGLAAGVISERNDAPFLTVIAQTPAPGQPFSLGEPIKLVVSEGPWLLVANVGGMKYEDAVRQLKKDGLVVVHGGGSLEHGSRRRTNCETDEWYPVVDRTDPAPGAKLFLGPSPDTVTVFTRLREDSLFGSAPPGQQCD